jgi:hypothetical protein
VEKGEKLGQLQFSLFISTLQNPNFAWRSCSNHREKHRTTFANIVEGCLLYNFCIYRFVAEFNFLEKIAVNIGFTCWNTSRSRSRAPPACRRSAWRPCTARGAFCRLGVRAGQVPPPRGTSHRSPSRLSPRNESPSPRSACRVVPPPRGQWSVACSPAECACRGRRRTAE